MKKIIGVLLVVLIAFSSCSVQIRDISNDEISNEGNVGDFATPLSTDFYDNEYAAHEKSDLSIGLSYTGLNDKLLLGQIEDLVYTEAVTTLNSEQYVVENVQAVFVSQEYIDEVMFNTQSNIYFGYNLDELNAMFEGTRYVFCPDEDGKTTVKPMEIIEDISTETMLKNIAIGTGVILVCATISCITAGIGTASAVSVIFAASAKTASIMALSGGALGGITAGIVSGIKTGDMNTALQHAALAGSEGFKWGAISGAIIGGGKEAFMLNVATKGGLTMNEVALIQKESKLPLDVIAQFQSIQEYEVYKQASLKTFMVNGKTALVQNIDLTYATETPNGEMINNLDRMLEGKSPIDPISGKAYELHHIGQNPNGTLAMLTPDQHRGKGVFSVLHSIWDDSGVSHEADWAAIKKEFWKYLGNWFKDGGTI